MQTGARCRVRLLGTPQVQAADGWSDLPLDKRLALLAVIACADGWVTRDRLAYLFWPDVPSARARINLRQLLSRAKNLPLPTPVESDDKRIRWQVYSDVGAFRAALSTEEWAQAVGAYAGDLIEGLELDDDSEFSSWLELERGQLREGFRHAALRLSEAAVAGRRFHEADRILEKLLERDPLDETAIQRRLQRHVDSGELAEARRLYERYAQRLELDLGLPPSAATEAILAEAARPAPAHEGRARSASSVREPLTSFVGRQDELSAIRSRLTAEPCRLLTVWGPGGTGKTRLALRAAADLTESFPDGVYVAQLAATPSVEAFPAALATALGIEQKGERSPMEQVTDALRDRHTLLVLDQFEHVGDAALMVAELLEACPDVRCLVTSRERLRLAGEWLLPLAGLEVPGAGVRDPEGVGGYAAVGLLLERARQVQPLFALTEATAEVAVRLCRTLAGLPLGIELAAGSLRSMTLEEVEQTLVVAPARLRTDALDVSERHRSLEVTFEHSWRLLNGQERDALAALAVLEGDFSASAAAAVTRSPLPVLNALVDKALLRSAVADRYDLHPAIRDMARERLVGAGELENASDRCATFYLHLLGDWTGRTHGPEQVRMIEQVAAEYPNVRAAWLWALGHGWVDDCLNVVDPMVFFHGIQGRFIEGAKLFAQSVSLLERAGGHVTEERTALLSTMLAAEAWYRAGMADFDVAVPLAERSVELVAALDLPAVELRGHQVLGSVAARRGEYETARLELVTGLKLAEHAHDTWAIGLLAGQLGLLELRVGNTEAAGEHFSRSLETSEEIGNRAGTVNALDFLGRLALDRGLVDEAECRFTRALSLAETARFDLRLAYLSLQLAMVNQRRGRAEEAMAMARSAVTFAEEHGQRAIRAESRVLLGRLLAGSGGMESAKARPDLVAALAEATDLGEVPVQLAAILELTLLDPSPDAAARLSLVATHPATEKSVRARSLESLGPVTVAPARLDETVTSLLAP